MTFGSTLAPNPDEDVASMGIHLLDPVVRHLPPWSYASEVAGPGAGARIGCAAVAAVARSDVASGETVFLMTTQHLFGWVGLGGALTRLGTVDEVTIVGAGEGARRDELVDIDSQRQLAPVLQRAEVRRLRWIAPAVSDVGALVERVTLAEADALEEAVRASADAPQSEDAGWIAAPEIASPRNAVAAEGDEAEVAIRLARLAGIGATPGHESSVRRMVLAEMPEWARDAAQVDELGNVWLSMGPSETGELADVFIAHMDEVGYEIESIAPSGVMGLRRRGGTVASAWEGQPARLQLESGAELNGVFLTRDTADHRRPERMNAWFGMDADVLATRGVRVGLGVTGYKEAHRIGAHRFSARSLDDRAGTTALLTALKRIDRGTLDRPVVFAWSVQEEGGLVGAGALAERLAAGTRQVFSVDTFVSSDTPLESPHFAYAPLGDGPVLRAIENSSLAPIPERERVQSIARSAGIPLQLGLTQGGTDGTKFTFWGAPNAGLSWPGRYSHSPAEVLDLRDLVGLHRLIRLLAESSSR